MAAVRQQVKLRTKTQTHIFYCLNPACFKFNVVEKWDSAVEQQSESIKLRAVKDPVGKNLRNPGIQGGPPDRGSGFQSTVRWASLKTGGARLQLTRIKTLHAVCIFLYIYMYATAILREGKNKLLLLYRE